MRRLGGWIRDARMPGVESHVDYDYATLSLPQLETGLTIDLRKWSSPIEDQSSLGSCVGNAVVGALELLRIRDGLPSIDLSRLFVYYNSRLMHQSATVDEGTYIRLAMGTLSSLGTCPEAKWPYVTSMVFTRPTWGSYRAAYANKIGSFYKIFSTGQERIDAITNALRAGHPVVFGVDVDQDFQTNVDHDGLIDMPKSTRVGVGGHAMVIVGIIPEKRLLIIRNSWGEIWGDKGYGYMPFDYLDACNANDFWVPFAPPTHV